MQNIFDKVVVLSDDLGDFCGMIEVVLIHKLSYSSQNIYSIDMLETGDFDFGIFSKPEERILLIYQQSLAQFAIDELGGRKFYKSEKEKKAWQDLMSKFPPRKYIEMYVDDGELGGSKKDLNHPWEIQSINKRFNTNVSSLADECEELKKHILEIGFLLSKDFVQCPGHTKGVTGYTREQAEISLFY